MLSTGNQLKAARALVGMEQIALAAAAGVNVGTIRKMEARGSSILSSGLDTIQAVQGALEAAGVEFLAADAAGGVGVRLRRDAVEG
ncbi:helix-turn-helix transcriptional regulator [Pannonibacter sp. I15F10I1]|uniref:helix-turn-helix domain-containing protein n=1 Tax=Pannonibacter sp. I15F10I1 TaxID=2003580 RepID=UPI0016446376|nr:helix-turn-helix transcriptional regulator [Pannonibacter sp. I15F10I1]